MRSSADRSRRLTGLLVVLVLTAAGAALWAQSTPAATLFTDARSLEQTLRKEIGAHRAGAAPLPLVRRARILVGTYEDLARLFPQPGQGDKALWQGAILAADVFDVFKDAADRATAVRLTEALRTKYAASALVAQAQRRIDSLGPPPAPLSTAAPSSAADSPAAPSTPRPAPVTTPLQQPTAGQRGEPVANAATGRAPARPPTAAAPPSSVTVLQAIHRDVLPDVLRVTLELSREVAFHEERIEGPARVFVDLPNTRAATPVQDARIAFADDVVRQIRVGRQLDRRVRVVLDLSDAPAHSVYTLYSPFRIVIDFERPRAEARTPAAVVASVAPLVSEAPDAVVAKAAGSAPAVPAAAAAAVAATTAPQPAPPDADRAISVPSSLATRPGGLTIARQLGLGIGRVVIDPGHGGHDPGAISAGVTESELVLDVALRLEQLLQKAGDVEVVLTRRTNVYVPLEERPALATREEADLYLSIHANASADRRVRGVETYILSFAPNARSEAVAARENRGSAHTMKSLPDIIRAIALNNKIDESRALARQVQSSLVEKLSKKNGMVRNLGVKQAPFAVLVGANMPSILAEIAFITNRQEAALVKTAVYRQQIAEALADGILRYQRRLKPSQVTAATK